MPFWPSDNGGGSGGGGGMNDPITMMLLGLGSGLLSQNKPGGNPFAGGAQGVMQALMLAQGNRQKQDERADSRGMRDMQGRKLQFEMDEAVRERDAAEKWRSDYKAANPPGGGGGQPAMAPGGGAPAGGGYFDTTGQAESGGNYKIPNAKGSGAYGKYQFMPDTWADVATKNPNLQLPFNMKQATDEQQEAAMREFTRMNGEVLQQSGIPVNPVTLYTAHRFGPAGAKTVFSSDPSAPISGLFPPKWTEQNPDLQGVTVAQWVQKAGQRFAGGGMPGAGVPQGDNPPADGSGNPLPPRQPQAAPSAPPQRPRGMNITTEMIIGAPKSVRPMLGDLLTIQNQERAQANSDRGYGLDVDKFGYTKTQDATKNARDAEEARLKALNAQVDPVTGRPNPALIDAEGQKAGAQERAKREAELDTHAATTLVTNAVKEFTDKERPKGLAIQESIPNLHNIRRMVQGGAITGTGTESRNFLAQLSSTLGFQSNEAALTPAYLGALADQIVVNAKALGVNPTNRDNEIIREAKGATTGNSKEAVLTLLDVQEDLQRRGHARYLSEAKRVQGLRGVKQAYGDDYFNLPAPPTYDEWSKANPMATPTQPPPPPPGFRPIGQPAPPPGFR